MVHLRNVVPVEADEVLNILTGHMTMVHLYAQPDNKMRSCYKISLSSSNVFASAVECP